MKKIENGVLYNTETAEELGEASSREYRSDFRWWHEILFRTKKGNYFLRGEGNGMSHWARKFSDGSGPGEGIRTIDRVEAKRWVENYLDADEYIQIFGAVEEA